MSRIETDNRVSRREATPRSTDKKVSARRKIIMAAANHTVSNRFMDSFSAVLVNNLDEKPTKSKKVVEEKRDILGEEIARLLNDQPHFCEPVGYAGIFQDGDVDDGFSFKPLLSSKNYRFLKRKIESWTTSKPLNKSKSSLQKRFQIFGNMKTAAGSFLMLFGLSFICLSLSSVSITLGGFWTLKFLWIVFGFLVSVIVDLNDLYQLIPSKLRKIFSKFYDFLIWVDQVLLLGRRYRGREWNKKSFEWNNPHLDNSCRADLWTCPPPSARDEGSTLHEQYTSSGEWSRYTSQHVGAIDFCYGMLREAFLRKQYSKLRKAVLSKENLNPIMSATENNGETIAYTRKPKGLEKMDEHPTLNSSEFYTPHGHDSIPYPYPSSAQSPTDAIEVIRERSKFFAEDPTEMDADSCLRLAPNDTSRFSAIDSLLEVELTESSVSSPRNRLSAIDSNSDATNDLNWMDVGAEIGMKLLRSSAVQKAIASQDTAAQISTIKEKMGSKLGKRKQVSPTLELGGIREDHARIAETENKLFSPSTQKKTPTVPFHPMWTSAGAAAHSSLLISPTQTTDSASVSNNNCPSPSRSRNVEEIVNTSMASLTPDQHRLLLVYDSKTAECTKMQESSQVTNPASDDIRSYTGNHSRQFSSRNGLIPPALPRITSTSRNFQSIEVVCDKKEAEIFPPPSRKNTIRRRQPLLPGVKIAVPIIPLQPGVRLSKRYFDSNFQMGTVISSKRIFVGTRSQWIRREHGATNCLTVTVTLDKSFLRDGKFAELTIRIMDAWDQRYMPKHSKLPLGSCVATCFGPGVLVGWRVEDDIHVVRSLWQRRGRGSAYAYLNRDAIHCTIEAAVGFDVETSLGRGEVVAYVGGAQDVSKGRFYARIKDEGKYKDCTLELNRTDIHACRSARFIPVVEHIREAAKYQLQVDTYTAALEETEATAQEPKYGKGWRHLKAWSYFSKHFDILWSSFMKAIDEDEEFDEGMNEFISDVLNFLDRLDAPSSDTKRNDETNNVVITATESTHTNKNNNNEAKTDPNFWLMNDVLGIFTSNGYECIPEDGDLVPSESIEVECSFKTNAGKTSYDKAYSVIRTLMRTVSIAKASCVDEPNFKLAMSVCYEFLLFTKTVIKVQQKNMSPHSLKVWRRAWEEIVSTFGPVKDRLEKIGQGIADRMQKQGRRAKVRLLRFVDIVVQDDVLLSSIELGEWEKCGEQVEIALVKSRILDEESREHYHKTALFIYNHFATASAGSGSAAARNNEKLQKFAAALQWMAAPRKFMLKLFLKDEFLDMLERLLVRVFQKEDIASRMLAIHSSNFKSLRHFRMLKDFTVAGKLWIPLLDAADAEFSWLVSQLPENTKDLMGPLSSLFSLCILQFHKIDGGDLTKDWLDFLLEDEAVSIIHEIDMKLILALESFSRDVKEMMVVLPYYPSIEDDILNLVDEVDLDEFLKEASEAIEDADKLSDFIREKSTVAIERFLDYVPKMSIPVEKRDLADGWVLTCRGADGGDLTLTDLNIRRDNLTCQVMGGDTIYFPMLSDEETDCKSTASSVVTSPVAKTEKKFVKIESSVLDHIREMILNAQRYGCWKVGVGGVKHPPTDKYVATVLHGLPVSSTLNCAIELWRNLEIDDDELLEVAVRDVSYQIQLHDENDIDDGESKESKDDYSISDAPVSPLSDALSRFSNDFSNGSNSFRHRFNPRVDPTVLFLEIKNLTFHLDNFLFRIEKHEDRRTIFDPVFDGTGSLLVANVSIKLRVDCLKEQLMNTPRRGQDFAVPALHVRELDVNLEKVSLKVKDTGADWLLNKVVKGFEHNISQIMAANLRDQVRDQIDLALENLNGYFQTNPDLILDLLNISIDDLEEKIVWV